MNASNKNHEPNTIDDLHDRLTDRGLAEVIGCQAPPDLSTRILAADIPVGAASRAAQPARRPRLSRPIWVSLAVAAMLLVGACILLFQSPFSARFVASSSAITDRSANNIHQIDQARKDRLGNHVAGEASETAASGQLMVGTAVNSDAGSAGQEALNEVNTPGSTLPSPYYLTDDVQHFAPSTAPGPKFAIEAAPGTEMQRYLVEHDQPQGNVGLQGRISDAQRSPADSAAPATAPTTFPALTSTPTDNVVGIEERNMRIRADANEREDVLREMSRPVTLGYQWQWRDQTETAEGTGPGLPGDQYTRIFENPFVKSEGGAAVSTFSIDVDTASYANVRQFLMQMNTLPPPDAVRIEELINYFDYNYAGPPADAADTPTAPGSAEGSESAPFAAHVEVAGCPWAPEHRLVRIGIKGREIDPDKRPKSNLVFLVDVSGSMNEPAKLPLVVYGLEQLTRKLVGNDRVAIVVYASSEGLVLPSTSGDKQEAILAALAKLQAGGSTAGGAGIQLAYQLAEDNFIEGGTNRVILCTDGDFNVGVTSTAELERMVEQKAKDTGVFLSVLGFGRGNLNDAMMEAISNHGNGNYSYVDNRTESRRVLVEEMAGTLVTIAKDVKIQLEFNPRQVGGYRLIGYENRMLRTEDFNDDKKDAGEIGAGHTVTALYEIVPAGKPVTVGPVDDLKYQQSSQGEPGAAATDIGGELLTLKMRYKQPDGDTSRKLEWPVTDDGKAFSAATGDFQFAAAVAGFGLLLRDSQYKGNLTYAAALELAQGGVGSDEHGYRGEFLEMIRRAKTLRAE